MPTIYGRGIRSSRQRPCPRNERQAFLDEHLDFIPEYQRATVQRLANQSARPAPRQSAVAIGSREREELGLRAARDIQNDTNLEYVRGNRARGLKAYNDDLYGSVFHHRETDEHGEVIGEEWRINSPHGTVSAHQTDIDAARGYAAEAICQGSARGFARQRSGHRRDHR